MALVRMLPSSLVELTRGPVLLAAAFLVWYVSDRLVVIGPFDRAQIGWAVVMPLAALAPGVAALPERDTRLIRASRVVSAGVSVGLGGFVLVGLAVTVTFANCRPVTSPWDVLPNAIPTALMASASYWFAYVSAANRIHQGTALLALLVGAAVWLTLAAITILVLFAVSFPPISCAPPR